MIVEKVRGNGGKIVVNEVTTGVGRTGAWFGYNHYDIVPDMVAIGKGIGNGYPVSVAGINKETIDQLESKPFKYAQSHQNDPLGATVVKEVVSIIEETDLIKESARKGRKFFSQLTSLIDNDVVCAVRGRGLMFAVDIVDRERTQSIYVDLIRNGYLVGNRGTAFRIDPPLTIGEDEFSEFVDAFRGCVSRSIPGNACVL